MAVLLAFVHSCSPKETSSGSKSSGVITEACSNSTGWEEPNASTRLSASFEEMRVQLGGSHGLVIEMAGSSRCNGENLYRVRQKKGKEILALIPVADGPRAAATLSVRVAQLMRSKEYFSALNSAFLSYSNDSKKFRDEYRGLISPTEELIVGAFTPLIRNGKQVISINTNTCETDGSYSNAPSSTFQVLVHPYLYIPGIESYEKVYQAGDLVAAINNQKPTEFKTALTYLKTNIERYCREYLMLTPR
jgi:hypothetical protein